MSPALVIACRECGNAYPKRPRAVIAEKLHEAVLLSLRQDADWTRRFQSLTAQLMWLEAELRGLCGNCLTAQAAAEYAALQVQVTPVPPTPPTGEQIEAQRCRVLPLRKVVTVRKPSSGMVRDLLTIEPEERQP